MTSTTPKIEPVVIHAAKIVSQEPVTLLLYKITNEEYRWFTLQNGRESSTEVVGFTKEEAIRKARKEWALACFRMLNCGFRYTLPERDEHGMNALFFQMKASLLSYNGIYFDDEVGHNCFVQNASQEAKDLMNELNDRKAST